MVLHVNLGNDKAYMQPQVTIWYSKLAFVVEFYTTLNFLWEIYIKREQIMIYWLNNEFYRE